MLYRLFSNYTKKRLSGHFSPEMTRWHKIPWEFKRGLRALLQHSRKKVSFLDDRGRDSKPCRVQRAWAVSYRGRQQGHPPAQSTSVASVVGTSTGFAERRTPSKAVIANTCVRGAARPNRSGVRKRGEKTRGQQTITPKRAASLVLAVTPLAERLVHPRSRRSIVTFVVFSINGVWSGPVYIVLFKTSF